MTQQHLFVRKIMTFQISKCMKETVIPIIVGALGTCMKAWQRAAMIDTTLLYIGLCQFLFFHRSLIQSRFSERPPTHTVDVSTLLTADSDWLTPGVNNTRHYLFFRRPHINSSGAIHVIFPLYLKTQAHNLFTKSTLSGCQGLVWF